MAQHQTIDGQIQSEQGARHLHATTARGPRHARAPQRKPDPATPATRASSQKRFDFGGGNCRQTTCRAAGCRGACPPHQARRCCDDSGCCRWQTHDPGGKSRFLGVHPLRPGCGEVHARAHHGRFLPVMEMRVPTRADQVRATNAADQWIATSAWSHRPQQRVKPLPHPRPAPPRTRRPASATCCPGHGCTLPRSHPPALRTPRLGHTQHKCYTTQRQSSPQGGKTEAERSTQRAPQRVQRSQP